MKATAIIYQPTKTAMQSGKGKTRRWLLEYAPATPLKPDALMGWISAKDTLRQIKLAFDSKEAAVAYAEENHIPYSVREPKTRQTPPKSYAANFGFTRIKAFDSQ